MILYYPLNIGVEFPSMHLKRLRTQRHLSQHALATKAGLSTVWIIQMEKGRVDPSLSTLRKLARALKVTVGVLVR